MCTFDHSGLLQGVQRTWDSHWGVFPSPEGDHAFILHGVGNPRFRGSHSIPTYSLLAETTVPGFSGNPTPSTVLADHWGYGSWNLLGVAAYWASGQILIVLIPVFLGLGASAAVAATWNIFRPISLAMQSMSLLVLPTFSKLSRKETHRYLWKRLVIRTALLFAGGVLFYGMVMSIFAKPVLNFLYQGKYDDCWLLVTLFAISMTASAITQILVLALKSANKVELASAVWGVSAIGTLILGVPLMLTLGLEGALGAFAFSYILAAMSALSKLWRVE